MVTWTTITGGLGLVVLIGNAGAYIYKVIRPALSVKEATQRHEDEIAQIKEHEKKDLEAIEELRTANRLQLRAMLSMINHMIDGNNVEAMKDTRDKIQDMLVE